MSAPAFAGIIAFLITVFIGMMTSTLVMLSIWCTDSFLMGLSAFFAISAACLPVAGVLGWVVFEQREHLARHNG